MMKIMMMIDEDEAKEADDDNSDKWYDMANPEVGNPEIQTRKIMTIKSQWWQKWYSVLNISENYDNDKNNDIGDKKDNNQDTSTPSWYQPSRHILLLGSVRILEG